MKTDRRDFLKKTIYLVGFGAAANSPLRVFAESKELRLTVLHTNDWHSRIDPFPATDKKFGGQGGAVRRAEAIRKIRESESNVLLLDSGDIFQGTPYFNFYGGELEYKLMSEMGYDACTLGNHDFDNGIEGLIKQAPFRKFPIINSNYDFGKTALANLVEPYRIFSKQGIRIGVFGLGIELAGLVPDNLYAGVFYNDPIKAAIKMGQFVRVEKKCELIICLSHLGHSYKENKVSDLVLAKSEADVDIILGGHTHTFLDQPVLETNKMGNKVIVNQVGWGGLRLGRLDLTFETQGRRKNLASSQLISLGNLG